MTLPIEVGDIFFRVIHLSRPVSTKHPPMPIEKHATQFNPFAALSGYEALATETARLTTAKASLSEKYHLIFSF